MKGTCLSPRLASLLLGLLLLATAATAGPVGYLDQFGKVITIDNPAATDAPSMKCGSRQSTTRSSGRSGITA
jgi:hypothetical protein